MASEIKRSANFNSKEESILLCLVKKYKTILENKKTNTINNKQKLECWKRTETAFNSESGEVFRDSIILRKKYENLKMGQRKKPSEITDIEIKEILGERINGLPSEFGGDAEIITIVNEPADNSSGEINNTARGIFEYNYILPVEEGERTYMLSVEEALDRTKDVIYSSKNFFLMKSYIRTKPLFLEFDSENEKNTVQNLRTPTSKALTSGDATRNKRSRNEYEALCNKVTYWAASKANFENDRSRLAMEEHNIKIKLMQQMFERECKHMKESEARIKKIERGMEVSVGIIE